MRILIADDHAVFRRGLKEVLRERFVEAKFGEAETAQAALEQVQQNFWDVMILDISMPGRSGLDILKDVRTVQPALPILILSAHPEEQYALRVIQAGASGYVAKTTATLDLVQAIEKALAGGIYVSPILNESLLKQVRAGPQPPLHQKLSNREYEILRMLGSGMSSKQIAQELNLSPQTVSSHRARILKKLGLHSMAELIRYAIEKGLA